MTAEAIINDGLAQLRADLLRRAIGEQATLAEALDLAREAWLFVTEGGDGQAEPMPAPLADLVATARPARVKSRAKLLTQAPPPHQADRFPADVPPQPRADIGGVGRKAWSQDEEGRLIEMKRKGLTGAEMAAALDRPQSSIWSRIDVLKRRGRLVEPVGSIASDQYKVRD